MSIPAPSIVPNSQAATAAQTVAQRKTLAGSQAAALRLLLGGMAIRMRAAAPHNAASATQI